MGNIKQHIQTLNKALKTLEEITTMEFSVIVRDASIQRFEYTFETFWKTIKVYLREKEGIVCNSPKSCFRELFSVNIINKQETEKILEMTDKRNLSSHTYIEKIAQDIYDKIINEYFILMKNIFLKIKN